MNKTLTFLAMPILGASLLIGCGGSGGSSSSSGSTADSCTKLNTSSFDCKTMLNDVIQQAVKPLVDDLAMKVQGLSVATEAYCAELPNSAANNQRQAAQDAWAETMTVWQQLEVMQFGPVGDVRDEFYNWPLNDACKVDDEVVKAIAADYDITTGVTPARRGFTGLEYLLFNDNLAISCSANSTSPALTAWNTKADAEKLVDRCDYAKDISADLVVRAQGLKTSLASYDVADLSNGLQASANLMSDALFYIDKKTKDDKLGDVLPKTASDSFKAESLEFRFSEFNREAIHNNLKGAQAILNGGTNNTQGLSLYLKAAGEEQLALDMAATLTTSINASNSATITESVRSIINGADSATCFNAADESSNLNKLCTLDDKIKDFTDHLKGQFVLTLGFTTPQEAEGDND